jgi:LysR family hca operon transcriptional activator
VELRHLRYFVAVAEEGSLSLAAEKRLHTAQPSLSRQIRDLETNIGVQLIIRGSRGIELTAAGQVFLDHARLVLMQVEAAGEAARRAVLPGKPTFALGFLTGYEMGWLPETLRLLDEDAPGVQVTLSSQSSPELAAALLHSRLDAAFLRREEKTAGLAFKLLVKEPLAVVMRVDHRLAAADVIGAAEVADETFIGFPPTTAPVLRDVVNTYARRLGIDLTPDHEAENLAMAISLVASTGGVTLLPLLAANLFPPSIVRRPLRGEAPTIDLVIGYNKANTSPLLKSFLSRVDDLIDRVENGGQPAGSVLLPMRR